MSTPRATASGMRLRHNLHEPLRYEDEVEVINFRKPYQKRNGSKPAFPELLAAQSLPYEPHQRPAAFPSLPLDAIVDAPTTNSEDEYDSDGTVSLTEDANFEQLLSSRQFVLWSDLELAYQYRLFEALSTVRGRDDARKWLRLSSEEFEQIKKDTEWRKHNPITLTEIHNAQETLTHCLEPDLMMKYLDLMVRISHYELGSHQQYAKASQYLNQCGLPLNLMGTWTDDPLGSGLLIDVSSLADLLPLEHLSVQQLQYLLVQAAVEKQNTWLTDGRKRQQTDPTAERPRLKKQQHIKLKIRMGHQDQATSVPPATPDGVLTFDPELFLPRKSNKTISQDLKSPVDDLLVTSKGDRINGEKIPFQDSLSLNPPERKRERSLESLPTTPSFCTDSSSGLRSSGSMSLRNRGALKETLAMVNMRKNMDFWKQSRRSESRERSIEQDIAVESPAHAPTEVLSSGGRPQKIITLKYDQKGTAYIDGLGFATSPDTHVSSAATNNSVVARDGPVEETDAKLAAFSDIFAEDASAMAITTPDAMQIESPAQSNTERRTVHFAAPESQAPDLGNLNNFETKLMISLEGPPERSIIEEDSGSAEDSLDDTEAFHTPRTHVGENLPSSPPIQHLQTSPLAGRTLNYDNVVVPSIETDGEATQAVNLAAEDKLLQLIHTLQASQGSHPHRVESHGRSSPERPRSISPISDDEGLEPPDLEEDNVDNDADVHQEEGSSELTPIEDIPLETPEPELRPAETQPVATPKSAGRIILRFTRLAASAMAVTSPTKEASPVEEHSLSGVEDQPPRKKQKISKFSVNGDAKFKTETEKAPEIPSEPSEPIPGLSTVSGISRKRGRSSNKPKAEASADSTTPIAVVVSRPSTTARMKNLLPARRSLRLSSVDPADEADGESEAAPDTTRFKKKKSAPRIKRTDRSASSPAENISRREPTSPPPPQGRRITRIHIEDDEDTNKEAISSRVRLAKKPAKMAANLKLKTKAKASAKSTDSENRNPQKGHIEDTQTGQEAAPSKPHPAQEMLPNPKVLNKNLATTSPAITRTKKARFSLTVSTISPRSAAKSAPKKVLPKTTAPQSATTQTSTVAAETASKPRAKDLKKAITGHRPITRARTPALTLLERESALGQDGGSEADAEASGAETKQSRKKWQHKEYTKTRESRRIADLQEK